MEPPEIKVLSIYTKISNKLHEMGFQRDWQECRTKMKGDYKKVKDHNGVTGNGRKTCKFYDNLDTILGHRPASAPSTRLDTGSLTQSTTEPHSQEVADAEEEARDTEGI